MKILLMLLWTIVTTSAVFAADGVTVFPSHGKLGKKYELTVTNSNCASLDVDLSKVKLVAPQGSGLNPAGDEKNTSDGCTKVVTFTIDPDAPTGTVSLRLEDDKGSIKKLLPFEIVASVPGPIPPGLTPQVDIQWHVVDPDVAEDNFGHRVRKLFHCIQLTVGNNSGYDLEVSTIGFTLNGGPAPSLGNTDYSMVRGSLDWGHKTNGWSLASLTLQAAGPVFTATLPLVSNATKRAHRSQLINILSPLATAMAFIYPYQDSFSAQFKHLDDSSLRAGYIIHNNQQPGPVFIFVAKKNIPTPPSPAKQCKDDDLDCVKHSLGQMVLVGQTIQYINRVSVVEAPAQTPNTPVTALSVTSMDFGQQTKDAESAPKKLVVTNTGAAPLAISKIEITGDGATNFKQANDCGPLPASLAANSSCTITITFKPAAAGASKATLAITDNAAGSPRSVPLTGTGQ